VLGSGVPPEPCGASRTRGWSPGKAPLKGRPTNPPCDPLPPATPQKPLPRFSAPPSDLRNPPSDLANPSSDLAWEDWVLSWENKELAWEDLRTPGSSLRTPSSSLRTPATGLRTLGSSLRTPVSSLRTAALTKVVYLAYGRFALIPVPLSGRCGASRHQGFNPVRLRGLQPKVAQHKNGLG